jgi:hypothetical protein
MSATTIKLDGDILDELQRMKPADETLTGLVRELLASELRRRRMMRAAADYSAFLDSHPDEAKAMETWAAAPLEREVRPAESRRSRARRR